jgi:hypothetical protein
MMRSLLVLLFCAGAASASAQLIHGNEWIDYNRQYWSFKMHANALARIDSTALANAGFPVTTVDPRHIMVWNREQQVPIYIAGEEDGVFNSGDFIEFRAQGNDAWLDARLFVQPEHLASPYYSYFNDTIRYYITWDATAPKERVYPYNNTDFDSVTPRSWFWNTSQNTPASRYFVGPNAQQQYGATSGFYLEGEGYFSSSIMNAAQGGSSEQLTTNFTAQPYTGVDAPNARINTVVVGLNAPANGGVDHHLRIAYGPTAPGTLAVDTTYAGFKVVRSSFEVPATAIGPTFILRFNAVADLNVAPNYADQQTVALTEVRYPRDFNMSNLAFMRMVLPNDPQEPLMNVTFNSFIGQPVIYAFGDSVRRIMPVFSAGQWRALIPSNPGAQETEAIILSETYPQAVTALQRVNGTGYFTDFSTMARDSALLIITHASLLDAAVGYASDREISTRNPVNTLVADVDELYDQFGGGIPKHALAIRRFCRYLLNSWTDAAPPRGLFLIGKSVQTHRLNNSTPSYRPDVAGAYANCLVPSYGHPASDACFTIGLNFNPAVYDIPVGRLSARFPSEVQAYREKVAVFESQQPAAWMKNILHFRGGFTPTENAIFANLMAPMRYLAEDTCFGGRVIDFKKNASDQVIQSAAADSVRMFIEDQGVTLMNFFAHAYADGFDITIDDPANYNWNGRHPMVIGNSCYIGNVHLNTFTSTPEKWVMMPGKGPIAFLASIDIGLSNFLAQYSTGWYRSFSQENYGRGIGEHMKFTAASLLQGGQLTNLNTVHTFTLQGDPSLILNSFPKPDYSITPSDILFDPVDVSADVDSFQVKAVVTNIGKAVNTSFVVEMERSAPLLGGAQLQATSLTNVYYQDTAYFTVPTLAFAGGQGTNSITVRLDQEPDEVPELQDTSNNIASTTLFITSGDLVPVYPYEYAIVPEPNPTLKASTGDPLAPVRTYIFQIDTTDLFNSPIMEMTVLQAPGGVVSWQPQNIYALNASQDSTVFFWRCTIDSTGNGGNYNWYERSFQYINGEHGWGQAHYFQFKKNNFSGVEYDRPERDFDFFSGTKTVRVDVLGNAQGIASFGTKWIIELEPQEYGNGCPGSLQRPAFIVAVIDPNTFTPWGSYWRQVVTVDGQPVVIEHNVDHQFGNQNTNGLPGACRNRVEKYFIFPMNSASSLNGLIGMMDAIPTGHHVLIYSWLYNQQDSVLFHAPGFAGAMQQQLGFNYTSVPDSVPFALYVRKGYPGVQTEVGTELTSTISLSAMIDASTDRGTITTVEAGPAQAWYSLKWRDQPLQASDSTVIVLQGIPPGEAAQPVDLYAFSSTVQEVDISSVNAQIYPKLRVQGRFHDLTNPDPDPSQIKRWQLLNAPAPECAIHPPLGYHNALQNLYQGQDASVAVAVQNISEFDMDSLLMTAWVVDQANVRRRVHYRVNQPLPPGAYLMDTIRFSTMGLGGANTLIIEANPIDTLTGAYHQLEQYHFNNTVQVRFNVERDITNPLLDVTFDGVHILDGDLVSARPEVLISLNDENTVLLLDSPSDTTHFKVFLTRPGAGIERLYFRDGSGMENMQFIPANGPQNEAKILYRPHFAQDGVYQLTVEAKDRSNNQSGDNQYRIRFEVITRPTITEVLNYPNPFTTNTRFVFTVTGHQVPTYMKIQILTVTGRVVREIGMHELGTIRIGRNMTEYAWDGTDQFGDRLARGVYLYRVIAKLNGEDIEYRSTTASEYFHKGFGKMYLLK